MKQLLSAAVGIFLQAAAAAACAQALDTNIMNDLTPTEQSSVLGGAIVTKTNPIGPGTNFWEVTYYVVIKTTDPKIDAFSSAAVYQDLENQPDYLGNFLLDYQIQAGTGNAAIRGLTATGDPEQPTLTHQINTVFRSPDPGNPANPLYSTAYQVTDTPEPTSPFLATYGNVDFQDSLGSFGNKVTVMRYHAVLVPAAAIAQNQQIKDNLIQSGLAVVVGHFERMKLGATDLQLRRLHRMLNDFY